MNAMLDHINKIQKIIGPLLSAQKALFLCAVCQRQFSIYEKLAKDTQWGNVEELREILNACWDWSTEMGNNCEVVIKIPSPEGFLDISFTQSSSSFALDVYASIEFLAHAIKNDDFSQTSPPVEYAFNILDAYIHEQSVITCVTQESEERVASNPLVTREIDTQLKQLAMVSKETWNTIDWSSFRRSALQQHLLD